MKGRNSGGKRANSCRDADRHIEHVIDHQGRGRKQAGIGAKIRFGYGVGTAIARIGLDRLAVGDVKDGQQRQAA